MNEAIICKCHNTEHILVFSYDEDWREVFVSVHLIPIHNIFKRIWYFTKYIFGYRCRYGYFDEFILDEKDIPKLENIIKHLKR